MKLNHVINIRKCFPHLHQLHILISWKLSVDTSFFTLYFYHLKLYSVSSTMLGSTLNYLFIISGFEFSH